MEDTVEVGLLQKQSLLYRIPVAMDLYFLTIKYYLLHYQRHHWSMACKMEDTGDWHKHVRTSIHYENSLLRAHHSHVRLTYYDLYLAPRTKGMACL